MRSCNFLASAISPRQVRFEDIWIFHWAFFVLFGLSDSFYLLTKFIIRCHYWRLLSISAIRLTLKSLPLISLRFSSIGSFSRILIIVLANIVIDVLLKFTSWFFVPRTIRILTRCSSLGANLSILRRYVVIVFVELFHLFGLDDCSSHLNVQWFDVSNEVVYAASHHEVRCSHSEHGNHRWISIRRYHTRNVEVSHRFLTRLHIAPVLLVSSMTPIWLWLLSLFVYQFFPWFLVDEICSRCLVFSPLLFLLFSLHAIFRSLKGLIDSIFDISVLNVILVAT